MSDRSTRSRYSPTATDRREPHVIIVMAPRPNTFRKHEHLRSKKDFERLFQRRCSVSDDRLIIYAVANGLDHSRVGFGVSRKVGSAVVRNRFRRIYREAYRLIKSELPSGLDLLLLPRSPNRPVLDEIKQSLRELVPQAERKLKRQEKKA